jgi:hypothetical protein
MNRQLTVIMVLILGLLLMACTAVAEPEPTAPVTAPELATPEPAAEEAVTPVIVDSEQITPEPESEEELREMPIPIIPDAARAMVENVRRDLAEQRNVDVAVVNVVEFQSVEWADSSLGCPQPDMMYLMVITPGYRIVLELDGEKYDYHTDRERYFVLCKAGQAVMPGTVEQ